MGFLNLMEKYDDHLLTYEQKGFRRFIPQNENASHFERSE